MLYICLKKYQKSCLLNNIKEGEMVFGCQWDNYQTEFRWPESMQL